jgi:hypothetical protein
MERASPMASLYVSLCVASLRQTRVRCDSYERVHFELSCSMRLKHACVSSTGEIFLLHTNSEASLSVSLN